MLYRILHRWSIFPYSGDVWHICFLVSSWIWQERYNQPSTGSSPALVQQMSSRAMADDFCPIGCMSKISKYLWLNNARLRRFPSACPVVRKQKCRHLHTRIRAVHPIPIAIHIQNRTQSIWPTIRRWLPLGVIMCMIFLRRHSPRVANSNIYAAWSKKKSRNKIKE